MQAMGVAQHHDAVSGTEKQHVAYDYALQLAQGNAECQTVISQGLSTLMTGASHRIPAITHAPLGAADALAFSECPFLNQSICEATTAGVDTVLVLYNNLGQNRTEPIRVPILAVSAMCIRRCISALPGLCCHGDRLQRRYRACLVSAGAAQQQRANRRVCRVHAGCRIQHLLPRIHRCRTTSAQGMHCTHATLTHRGRRRRNPSPTSTIS